MTKKIYFYYPSIETLNQIWINPVPIYLSAHLKKTRPELANQIEWARYCLEILDQETLITEINDLNIDLLLLSVYVWNQDHIYSILKNIKSKINKPITIIVGGPSVDPYRNKNYFAENPDIDYAVFAQGEEAFANILDYLTTGAPLSLLNCKNLAWKKDDQLKLSDFEFLRLDKGSPYVEASDVLRYIADQTVNNPKYKDSTFFLPYESSKGCPYNCTYCDWTSGLTHKVYHRNFAIEEELNLLGSVGMTNLSLSDANFGQHRQDIEIIKILADFRKNKKYNFKLVCTGNWSKLKTENNFKIIDLAFESSLLDNVIIAVQDIDETVLKNIERPAVPWEVLSKYLILLKQKYPDKIIMGELILGLPGQTIKSWEQTLIKVSEHSTVHTFWFILLPGSPAGYDSKYRNEMKIKTKKIYHPSAVENRNSLYETVVETYSFNFNDYMYMILISELVIFLDAYQIKDIKLETIFDQIKNSIHFNSFLSQVETAISNPDAKIRMKNIILKLLVQLNFVTDRKKFLANLVGRLPVDNT